jgi:hypothetical protein
VHVEAEDRRSFITGVNTNPSNSAIATSVIALGHQLNLNVIAEGVETVAPPAWSQRPFPRPQMRRSTGRHTPTVLPTKLRKRGGERPSLA